MAKYGLLLAMQKENPFQDQASCLKAVLVQILDKFNLICSIV